MSAIRALVVDDSGIMRKMVIRALQQSGMATFAFSQAQDGVEALARFNPRVTDIVFVDWNMPNMDGLDLVRRLRRQCPERHVPIVMVTAERTTGKVEEALTAGADHFISKPFTVDDFEARLGSLISRLRRSKRSPGFFQRLVT